MDGLVALLASLLVVAVVVAGILAVRYARLRGEVAAVLERTDPDRHASANPRSLYRTVRELDRDLDAARREASLLRVAVDRTELGIVIADRTKAIVFTNPAADLVMQGRLGDAVARSRVLQLIERVTYSGTGEELELDLYTPVRRMLNLTAVPLPDDNGRMRAAVVYIIDFTDRHRVEAMRRDFIANASHELKTPLGALSLLAETLVEARDDAMRVRLAQRLQAEATRMAKVIDDVLVLAETESMGTEHVPMSVASILEEAVDLVRDIAAEKGIEISRGRMDDAVIAADRQQLLSAFGNLLDNAVTYTAVKDEPGTVTYRCMRDEAGVVVEVQDTGIGIPERYTDRVFERFFCVDRARSRETGGTGLGLSIVRNVAIAHGGTVSVRSQVGVGSTFAMRLPALLEEVA